jgi:hypothetical protein
MVSAAVLCRFLKACWRRGSLPLGKEGWFNYFSVAFYTGCRKEWFYPLS